MDISHPYGHLILTHNNKQWSIRTKNTQTAYQSLQLFSLFPLLISKQMAFIKIPKTYKLWEDTKNINTLSWNIGSSATNNKASHELYPVRKGS